MLSSMFIPKMAVINLTQLLRPLVDPRPRSARRPRNEPRSDCRNGP